MITLLDAQKEILYQGPGRWEIEKEKEEGNESLHIEIESQKFSFSLLKTKALLRLETKETLEMKLRLYLNSSQPGKAQVQTPYGLLELPAGLARVEEKENLFHLSYWIGENDLENTQSFTIQRSNDD